MNGWIKLHRKLLENPIFSNEKGLKVWIWCLLKANHADQEIYLGMKKITLKSGQFVFGRESAGGQLKMAYSTVRNWITILKQDSYIDINSTNKYSIVTINKWSDYQLADTKEDNKIKTNHTTDGQQMDTDKNIENDKNNKEETNISYLIDIPEKDIEYFLAKYKCELVPLKQKADSLYTYCKSKGKKYKNYKAFLENAVRKDFGYRPFPSVKKEFEFDPLTKTAKIKSINI